MSLDPAVVQQQVRDHLMLNFTDMAMYAEAEVPVFVAGDGCEVIDVYGRRYIDGLSGLYCANLGHDVGAELGRAAAAQMAELGFAPTWTVAHPRAAELAERIAALAPRGLNRVFFTTGGGEGNEAVWKFARQWHASRGEPQRRKAIARRTAYHGTSLAALSFTGLDYARDPFLPMAIPVTHVSEPNAYRHPAGGDPQAFTAALLGEIEQAVLDAGPDEVALVIAEPVQNAGGCFVAPEGYWSGLRRLCDRFGILLVADEVITGFGRVGDWFASLRYGIEPDMITFAKGASAGHIPLGGVVVHDRVAEPFVSGGSTYTHGVTYSGHPVSCAVGLRAIELYEELGAIAGVAANEQRFHALLEQLRGNELVGDVRGAGYFWALELVRDRDTKQTFTDAEADWLLRQVLSARMYEGGLLCRLDDRGDPVVQLSPPLVADVGLLERMVGIVGDALDAAAAEVRGGALERLAATP